MRLRSVLSAAAAALVLAAPSALAAPFSYADPVGDAAQPGLDIVRVSYSLTRTSLVVRMDLAGPPVEATGVVYRATATVQYCGEAELAYAPGTAWEAAVATGGSFDAECRTYRPAVADTTGYALPVAVQVSGNSIVWTVPLADLNGVVVRGSAFREFVARAEPSDPAFGVVGLGSAAEVIAGQSAFDVARSAATWKMG